MFVIGDADDEIQGFFNDDDGDEETASRAAKDNGSRSAPSDDTDNKSPDLPEAAVGPSEADLLMKFFLSPRSQRRPDCACGAHFTSFPDAHSEWCPEAFRPWLGGT